MLSRLNAEAAIPTARQQPDRRVPLPAPESHLRRRSVGGAQLFEEDAVDACESFVGVQIFESKVEGLWFFR